mgnify:CR=1 FL=1
MSRSLEPCSLSAATRVSRTLCPPARPPHPRPSSSLGPAHPPIRPPHLRLLSCRLYDEDSSRWESATQWVGPAQVPDGLRRQETSFGASTLRQHSRGRLPSGHAAFELPRPLGALLSAPGTAAAPRGLADSSPRQGRCQASTPVTVPAFLRESATLFFQAEPPKPRFGSPELSLPR